MNLALFIPFPFLFVQSKSQGNACNTGGCHKPAKEGGNEEREYGKKGEEELCKGRKVLLISYLGAPTNGWVTAASAPSKDQNHSG